MSIAEKKAAYETSGLKVFMDAAEHEICERCYCCDLVSESATCWQCGGFADDEDGDWPTVCSVCGDEGEIYFKECIGRCNDAGEHEHSLSVKASPKSEGCEAGT